MKTRIVALLLASALVGPAAAQEPPEGALRLKVLPDHGSTPVAAAYLERVDAIVAEGGACEVPAELARMLDPVVMPPEHVCPFVDQVRRPAGVLRERTLMAHQPIPQPPKAPEGEYLILLYDTVTQRGRYLERVIVRGLGPSWFIVGHQMMANSPGVGGGGPARP